MKETMTKLKPNKNSGPDGIHVNVLRQVPSLAIPLHNLFAHSIRVGTLPQDWRGGNISPIFKKGSRLNCENYRPVTLTSQVIKLLERLVLKQIICHLKIHDIISCQQHGFQHGASCVSQLLECLNDWSFNFDNNWGTDCIYLDFSKAFDSVPHKRLLHKLNHYGIRGKLHDWVNSFLSAW